MSKGRKVAKYTLAGALSGVYGLSALVARQHPGPNDTEKTWLRHAAIAGGLSAVTWLIATL